MFFEDASRIRVHEIGGEVLDRVVLLLKIAGEARDRFGATVCVGVAAMIFWHAVINIGMVSGTLPVVGVTLPLISYGGTTAAV